MKSRFAQVGFSLPIGINIKIDINFCIHCEREFISERLSGISWDARWGIDDLDLGHLGILELSIGVIQLYERLEVLLIRLALASVANLSETVVLVVALDTDPVTLTQGGGYFFWFFPGAPSILPLTDSGRAQLTVKLRCN